MLDAEETPMSLIPTIAPPHPDPRQELSRRLADDIARWTTVVDAAGVPRQ